MAKQTIRGIDHLGIYVPDMEAATRFFQEAFGARIIYISLTTSDPALDLDAAGLGEKLGIAPKSVMKAQRFIDLGKGPDLELFEIQAPNQKESIGTSDFGINHFAVYADDIEAAVTRFEQAGGRMLFRPSPIGFPTEQGEGVQHCYGATPWGMTIEFMTYPGEMGYESTTQLRRWSRGS